MSAVIPYLPSLAGGMILGLACVLLLIINGRIAGISGIVGRLLAGQAVAQNLAFVLGLLAGPYLARALSGGFPAVSVAASTPVILLAGLLVGVGTRLGSGCTSGHGILGLARFSRRSAVATAVFLGTGVLTATLMGMVR